MAQTAPLQLWIGGKDVNYMLLQIGGWQLGCQNARECAGAVMYAIEAGFVGFRTHYAKDLPKGIEAYEVTDKGIEQIRRSYGNKSADGAIQRRQWYRDNTAGPKT